MTPPDCDLRDYPWMPLDVRRLLTSETWMDGPAEGKVAALSLWCEAWCQVPAGSLPDNERILHHLSQSGPAWPKVRAHALRGWIKCSDGRLYHPVVAEKANEAWRLKMAQKARTEAARKAKLDRLQAKATDSGAPPVTSSVTDTVTGPVTENVTRLVAHTVTGSTVPDRTGPYLKKEDSVPSGTDAEAASAVPSPADLLWSVGVPILKRLTSKSDGQCRTMLGKMRRDVQDDCPRLLLILQEAASAQHVDPVAWLTAATGGRKSGESASDRRIREQRETMHRLVYGEDEPVTIDQIPDRSLLQ